VRDGRRLLVRIVWAVNMARGRAVQLEILASRLPECG
jgi:hypothetical protein